MDAMKPRLVLTLIVSAIAGAAVWAFSPHFVGTAEPWDAGLYYYAALFIAGCASGLISPRPFWAHYVGGILGQTVYAVAFLPLGPLAGFGLLFMLVYSLPFVVGAALGLCVRFLPSLLKYAA